MENGKYTGIDGNKVFLKWDEQAGVTGYEVYRSTAEGDYGEIVGGVTAPAVTYTDVVPSEGTFYYYIRPYTETKGAGNHVSNISFGDYSSALKVDITSVTIEFNSNVEFGGQTKQQSAGKNFEITLDENTFSNAGFTFEGWNTRADSTGTKYTDGQTCSFAENTVLYAMWKIDVPADFSAQILDGNITLT